MSVARVKSKLALQWSIDQLALGGKLRMWTFTLPVVQDVKDSCHDWSTLCRALVDEVGFTGVRVFELHEYHGLHVHVVVNQFYPVTRLRAIARSYGWGRVHVKRCQKQPYYVAKYVSKSQREGAFRGRRLWATFGTCKAEMTRVKDIETTSGKSFAYRSVEKEPWLKRARAEAKLTGGGKLRGVNWQRYQCATWSAFWYWLEFGALPPPLGGGGASQLQFANLVI